VSDVQPYPLCVCGHRYDHHRHHAKACCYRCVTCPGYDPRTPDLRAYEPRPARPPRQSSAEVLARLEDSSDWLVDRQTREYEQEGNEE
jgi:hypothetical protein